MPQTQLIGRQRELAGLLALLGLGPGPGDPDVGTTSPVAVLLGGDAGIGKTRLLDALVDAARERGWRPFIGHSLDLAESGLPYLAFSEVVARIGAELPEVLAEATATHPALARLQPGRRVLGGPVRLEADREALDRGALFEAARDLMSRVGGHEPVLVVLEDLHWADSSTRDLLGFLLSRPLDGRVMFVASYRSDDLHRRHPLRPYLAEWGRRRGVHRVQLDPLPPQDVHRLITRLHPDPLPAAQANSIVERAEGNAFFVEELLGALAGSDGQPGSALPLNLADLLLVRLDQLDEDARQVVRVAAVAGRRVSHGLLAAICGFQAARLDEAVRRTIEMNILRADDQHYAFRHALLAEAAYDDLLPGERVRLHARYVEALTDRRGTGTAAELARHAHRALDRRTALAAGVEAAREAMSVGGPDDAARHYEAALELLADPVLAREQLVGLGEESGDPESAAAESGRLEPAVVATEAVEALMAGGHVVRAAALAAEQLGRLPVETSAPGRARLLSARALALSLIEPDEDPVAVSAEAVRLLGEADTPLRAKVLAAHARILAQAGRDDQARRTAGEAVRLADQLGWAWLAGDALTTISRAGRRQVGPERRAALVEAMTRSRQVGNRAAELRGGFWLALSYLVTAEYVEAEASLRAGVTLGADLGTPWAPYAFECRWYLAWVLLRQGRWDEALDVLADPHHSAPPIAGALLDALAVQIAVARGEPEGVGRLPAMRRFWQVEGLLAVTSAGVEIEAAGLAGELSRAVEAYRHVVAVMSRVWHPLFQARLRLATTALSVIADGAQHLPTARWAEMSEVADELAADVEQVFADAAHPGVETLAWAGLGRAEHARWHWLTSHHPEPDHHNQHNQHNQHSQRDQRSRESHDSHDRHDSHDLSAEQLVAGWTDAVAGLDRFGDVHLAARARVSLAEILMATGEADAARRVAASAGEVARRLGAQPLLDRLARLPGGTSAARAGSGRNGRGSPLVLTPREHEVLELVALGRSNGEIGARLFISTKTVSVHVSNILAKLGASGRTEAAALARRQGLIEI
ncbi:MAG: AAA family ATPase [Kineosporiaceae bacterium]|nr:AAA family ATPase [Kineosporiaceae bacterium]